MRGEMGARVLQTAKLKVNVDALELCQRIGDEIFVAQLAEPLGRDRCAGFRKIAVELVEGRQHVILDRRRAVGQRLGPRRLAALHFEQAEPRAHA